MLGKVEVSQMDFQLISLTDLTSVHHKVRKIHLKSFYVAAVT